MRISDWSSDVCSSDLSVGALKQLSPRAGNALDGFVGIVRGLRRDAARLSPAELVRELASRSGLLQAIRAQCKDEASFQRRKQNLERSEERRVGQECVSTGSTRWTP